MGSDDLPPPRKADINNLLRGASPEIRKLLHYAHEQGYTIARTSKKHFSVMTPSDHHPEAVVYAAQTPSSYLGVRNLRARLRRIGVEIPHQGR